ncbi:hypothetical protein LLG46_09195 [bacterium]|nr:hypothetical protein [bacterium]
MIKMVKCFWCGAENSKHQDVCCVCKRKLQWTAFFKGVLHPSVGCLMGAKAYSGEHKPASDLRLAS